MFYKYFCTFGLGMHNFKIMNKEIILQFYTIKKITKTNCFQCRSEFRHYSIIMCIATDLLKITFNCVANLSF